MSQAVAILLLCVFTINTVVAQYGEPENPPPEENPCNLVDCIPNTRCVVENGVAKCLELDFKGDTICEGGVEHCPCTYRPKDPRCVDVCEVEAACVAPEGRTQSSYESNNTTCPANEEFKECGTACEPSCRNPNPEICTEQCVVGCQCKSGFYRNDQNVCVARCSNDTTGAPDNTTCPANEEFKECGTACEPSCRNPNPEICTEQCVRGCQCRSGYYRNDENVCVSNCTGPGSCGVNEERQECGTACEPTCAQPNPVCTKQCVINVCQCKRLYIRDSSNVCVPRASCPTDRVIPCSELNCPSGTRCELGRVICPFVPPCFTQQSQCVPTDSYPTPPTATTGPQLPLCSQFHCVPGTRCLVRCQPDNDTSTTAPSIDLKVESGITCANIRCRDGFECRQDTINCVRAPCPQPRPRCVPTDTPQRTCDNVRCPAGTECQQVPLNCLLPPCPQPPPQCVPIDTPQRTCDNVRCPAGTECQQVPLNCFVPPCPQPPPQCVPIEKYNPCAATTCPVGSQCRSRDVVCVRAPCNPVAECVPTKQDPQCNENESYRSCASQCEPTCSNKNPTCILSCAPGRCQCNIGFYRNSSGSCVTEADCDGTAQQPTSPGLHWTGIPPLPLEPTCNETSHCANRTHQRPTHLGADCSTSHCSNGTVCQMVVVKDIHAAQRIKEPHCINEDLANMCNTVKCKEGYECDLVQHACFTWPCSPDPQCLPKGNFTTPMFNSTRRPQVKPQDDGLHPPYVSSPSLAGNKSGSGDTCSSARCYGESQCRMVMDSCHHCKCPKRPQCLSKALANMCDTVRCGQGYECKLVQHECLTWPCYAQPQCMPKDNHCGTNTTITRPPRSNGTDHNSNHNNFTLILNGTTPDKQCGQNEEYTDCLPHCQTTCRGIQECTKKTNATCTPGCTCKPGYRHNGLGKCVLPRHCYLAPGCRNNETWSKCSTCEQKCGVESQTCSLCYSGCACNDGYARNSSNICTRIENCA